MSAATHLSHPPGVQLPPHCARLGSLYPEPQGPRLAEAAAADAADRVDARAERERRRSPRWRKWIILGLILVIIRLAFAAVVAPIVGRWCRDARPANTTIVSALVDPRMKIEIEVTAKKRG